MYVVVPFVFEFTIQYPVLGNISCNFLFKISSIVLYIRLGKQITLRLEIRGRVLCATAVLLACTSFSLTETCFWCQIASKFLKPDKKTADLVGNEKMKASKNVRHIIIPCSSSARPQLIPDIIRCYGRLVASHFPVSSI